MDYFIVGYRVEQQINGCVMPPAPVETGTRERFHLLMQFQNRNHGVGQHPQPVPRHVESFSRFKVRKLAHAAPT
jgi:hypothetical protein